MLEDKQSIQQMFPIMPCNIGITDDISKHRSALCICRNDLLDVVMTAKWQSGMKPLKCSVHCRKDLVDIVLTAMWQSGMAPEHRSAVSNAGTV